MVATARRSCGELLEGSTPRAVENEDSQVQRATKFHCAHWTLLIDPRSRRSCMDCTHGSSKRLVCAHTLPPPSTQCQKCRTKDLYGKRLKATVASAKKQRRMQAVEPFKAYVPSKMNTQSLCSVAFLPLEKEGCATTNSTATTGLRP